ncbi:hypothetical protein ONS95_001541 [Cadophora gregata]|uniref:uncharacterized protein n=1 Tax=Cadophora gregata TaxID=51156 RepID=UPI0026DD5A50|nr:uncharacterized protein ONS95_001541 [Cadophora gregata]KAK0111164.1 hypothetical protein ONS95_001541 [Cadophora gregata]
MAPQAPNDSPEEEIQEPSPYTQALAKRVIRKIDMRILAIMFVTYNLNFMGKVILSSAAVFGLSEDNHLVGKQYSWVSSIFYFGYLFFEYPTTILIQKLPIGKYLSGVILLWGAIVASTAACTSFGGLATCRFLLGVAEATISPAFVYVTAIWYTRDEIPARTGVWFTGNSCGGFIASLLAYGIGQIEHPLHPWQWMFIIFGVITSVWSVFVFFLLPDTINDASFLTEEEKHFGNLALKSFGFTSLESTLITLPASVVAMSTILGTGWLASRFRNITTFLIIAVVIPPVVGSAIISSDERCSLVCVLLRTYSLHSSTNMARLMCSQLQTGPGAIPLSLGLVSSNYKGVTKKMTVTAIIFLTYCAGSIAGPQTFKTTEKAAGYPTAFKAILICYGLVIFVSQGLRLYLAFVNKKRDREEVEAATWETDVAPGKRQLTADDYEDVTDLHTPGFRYRL